MLNLKELASNVNRFGQPMCDLQKVVLLGQTLAAHNMGLGIAGGQWLIEHLYFYQPSLLADSLVLRNARHRQAPNRCVKSG
jgi:hypothetical protein